MTQQDQSEQQRESGTQAQFTAPALERIDLNVNFSFLRNGGGGACSCSCTSGVGTGFGASRSLAARRDAQKR